MNVLLDLNVLLDVIQRREPHFGASAAICAMAVRKEIHAFIPAVDFDTNRPSAE